MELHKSLGELRASMGTREYVGWLAHLVLCDEEAAAAAERAAGRG